VATSVNNVMNLQGTLKMGYVLPVERLITTLEFCHQTVCITSQLSTILRIFPNLSSVLFFLRYWKQLFHILTSLKISF